MGAGAVVGEQVVPFPAVAVEDAVETARGAMVKALVAYFGTLTFRRPGMPIDRFKVKPRNLLDEWPDPEHKLEYPTIAVVGGTGTYQEVGFTPAVVESSFGVYGKGTALVQLHEYVESLQVTVWGASRGERKALLAGLETAFSPLEDRHGLALETENYYDRVAKFTLISSVMVDEEAIRGSRRADLSVEGRIPVVRLAAFGQLRVKTPVVTIERQQSLEDDDEVPQDVDVSVVGPTVSRRTPY